MTREEILAKSRNENKNQDLYEKEVLARGNLYACIASAALATLFFVVQIIVGGGQNYGLYAVVFAMPMASFWVKVIKLKKKHELWIALIYTMLVIMLTAAQLYTLISASMIL